MSMLLNGNHNEDVFALPYSQEEPYSSVFFCPLFRVLLKWGKDIEREEAHALPERE